MQYRCKKCERDRVYQWNKENPERLRQRLKKFSKKPETKAYRRNWSLFKNFGITEESYERLLAKQNGRCRICCVDASTISRRLAVDHDHATGSIRGLLCHNCNMGLGLMQDSIPILEHAIAYLRESHEGGIKAA